MKAIIELKVGSMDKPKVSIIILNFNGRKYLGEVLDKAILSALNQTYQNVEVIFADNGSMDDSVNHVRNVYGDRVKVVELGRNYGFCLGNNLAFRYVDPEAKYVLFLNPDAVLSPNYVERLVSIMEADKTIGIAQGLQVSFDDAVHSIGGYVDSYGRAVEVDIKPVPALERLSKPIMVLWASGSAMLIRKDLFKSLGGFSPEFFMYHDEIDLCSRALAREYRVVSLPSVRYYHKRGTDAGTNWVTWYFANRNRWLTTIRYLPTGMMLKSLLLALPLEFLINVMKSIRKKDRARAGLYVKILTHIMRNLRRELRIRKTYYPKLSKVMPVFIMDIPNPLIREKFIVNQALSRLRNYVLYEKNRG